MKSIVTIEHFDSVQSPALRKCSARGTLVQPLTYEDELYQNTKQWHFYKDTGRTLSTLSVKRFERSRGLDTALYKNLPLLFSCMDRDNDVVSDYLCMSRL